MCGIAGIIDLNDRKAIAPERIEAMAEAIVHRGPDEDGFLHRPGLAFASRRLSIVGLADGRQPIHNEDQTVSVVYNGELFDYPELRAELAGRGHKLKTSSDTEVIPHLWEDHQEEMFSRLRGQFAFALHDSKRRSIILARDRFGICPLYWAEVRTPEGNYLVFASEIKAILASGLVEPRANPRGINTLFTFFAMPGPATCFQGINYLPPGKYLRIQLGASGETARISEHTYWQLDFAKAGEEDRGHDQQKLVDQFEEIFLGSVTRRLRADVPVVSYLSGGVDSSVVVAIASKVLGRPIPCFTIRIKTPQFDETTEAGIVAKHVGAHPTVVDCGAEEVLGAYPELIRAAESPVVDTSCAALLLLAREVHRQGYKVALTGEGADEWLAGYPWHKINRVLGYLDFIPGVRVSQAIRRMVLWLTRAPRHSPEWLRRAQTAVGGHNGWHDIYGLMSLSRLRFFSDEMLQTVSGHVPWEDLGLDPERMKQWHPLNRELCVSARAQLCGLLLNHKGDRVAMNSSVETRYPFLDEEVFSFLANVHPRWKLRGVFKDKVLLRHMADRWLPSSIAWRRKAMFRAPFDSFHLEAAPPFVEDLFSRESLRRTGYFNPETVHYWRKEFRNLSARSPQRVSIEMGLVAVFATQLWHHTFIDGNLTSGIPGRESFVGEPSRIS